MHFWQDDYTHLYFAQNNIRPAFPYQVNTYLVKLFFTIFGAQPVYYFAFGVFLVILTSLLIYLFIFYLSADRLVSLAISLLVASGYVGQQTVWMMSGDGMGVLVGTVFFVLCIWSFLILKRTNKRRYLIFSLVLLFLTLEVASHRFLGLAPLLIFGEAIYANRKNIVSSVVRSISFLFVMVIQYAVHPTMYLYSYSPSVSSESGLGGITGLINSLYFFTTFNVGYIATALSNYGNLFFPDVIQGAYFNFLQRLSISAPIVIVLYSFSFTVLGLLLLVPLWAGKSSRGKKSIVFLYILVSIVMAGIVAKTLNEPAFEASVITGMEIVLIFSFSAVSIGKHSRQQLFLFLNALLILSLFVLTKPDFTLNSIHRYVYPIMVAASFSYYLVLVNRKGRHLSLLLVGVLIISRIYLAISSQTEFVSQYSEHARNYFTQLLVMLPSIEGRNLFYVEPATRDLWFSIGDAARVGQLPSEAVYAFYYEKSMEDIYLPEDMDEARQAIVSEGYPQSRIHIMQYDGKTLTDNTELALERLNKPNLRSFDDWEELEGSYVLKFEDRQVYSLWDVETNIHVSSNNKTGESGSVYITWQYDTYGPIFKDKEYSQTVSCEQPIDIDLFIPAGGMFLKSITVSTKGNCDIIPGLISFKS